MGTYNFCDFNNKVTEVAIYDNLGHLPNMEVLS